MSALTRASLLSALALGFYPSCTGGGGGSLTLSASPALAKGRVVDTDPNFRPYDDAVSGEYVVTFASGSYTPPADPGSSSGGGGQTNVVDPLDEYGSDAPYVAGAVCADYGATFQDAFDFAGGFYCTMTETQARAMSHDGRVAFVESNLRAYSATVQTNPGWALDRIDQRQGLTVSNTAPTGQYVYNATGAASTAKPTSPGVDAWIVDSGIYAAADEFNNLSGRVVAEFPNALNKPDSTCASLHPSNSTTRYTSSDDDFYHGTAVADVLGGKTWGVAKGVQFHAVKVTDDYGKGYLSSIVAGLNYVLAHLSTTKRAVLNMSLVLLPGDDTQTGLYSPSDQTAMAKALNALSAKNVVIVSCAGNNHTDASQTLPAAFSQTVSGAITVAATMTTTSGNIRRDGFDSSYSNFGSVVDLCAPGTNVSFVKYTGAQGSLHSSQTTTGLGTSFASPLVAGVAALRLRTYPTETPTQVKQAILSAATTNGIAYPSPPSGTPNRLLFTNGL